MFTNIKIYFIILFLFNSSVAFAGPTLFSRSAAATRTNTSNFDGILDSTDINVQEALETLDDLKQSTVPCETTDNWCFYYDSSKEQLILYVNDTIQMKWPQIAAVQDKLLLEASFGTGTDKILIEGSVTDVLLLE